MSEAQVGRNSIDTAYGLTGNFLDQEYSRDMYNTLKVNLRWYNHESSYKIATKVASMNFSL